MSRKLIVTKEAEADILNGYLSYEEKQGMGSDLLLTNFCLHLFHLFLEAFPADCFPIPAHETFSNRLESCLVSIEHPIGVACERLGTLGEKAFNRLSS